MKESEFANLESLLYDIKARYSASPTRTKHLNYFLEGIRSDAKKLVSYSNSAQWLTINYGMMPTFLKPFEATIGEKVSDRLGNAFASAKCLYDNLNRFLQVAYLPEEEIAKRNQKIENSKEDPASAWGRAYELGKFNQIANVDNTYLKNLVSQMNEINEGNELTRNIRNAAMHGHGHILLDKDKKGFFLSDGFSMQEKDSKRLYAENLIEGLSNFYLGLANKYLKEFTEQSKDLMPLSGKDQLKLKARKAGYNFSEFSKLYAKYMLAPLTAVTLGLGIAGSEIERHVSTIPHNDEQTRMQLTELSEFERQVKDYSEKAKELAEDLEVLDSNAAILMSYTNKPAGFNSERVAKEIKKLKRVAEALKEE